MITLQERVHGVIPPSSWIIQKLHYVFSLRRGFKNNGMLEDNLLSLSYGEIIRKSIDTSEGLLPESFETYQIVEPGNIVLRLTDLQNDKRSLRQGLVRERGIITSAYDALQLSSDHNPHFWAYALLALDLAKYYYSLGGGVRQSIKFEDFPNDWLATPSLEEQKAIADFLDRETTRIDKLIEKKQRVAELAIESQSIRLDMMTFNSPVAANWERIPFKWICRIPSGQIDPKESPWADLPLIAPNHIESGTGRILQIETAREQGAESGKYTYPAGTVLYSKIRPALAKACIAPSKGLCSADMYPIIPSDRLLPTYLLMQLLSKTFTDWSVHESMRVAMPKINREAIGTFRFIVPPIKVQEAFINAWITDREKIQILVDKVMTSIDGLKNLRSALITGAVTGQIDVATWTNRGATDQPFNTIDADTTMLTMSD